MSIPNYLSTMEKMQNMKNMIGEGFIENLKPAIKLHQNENVLKMLELAKDKPDSCLELLSVAIFHHNVPIIKNILEKFDIKESDSPFINAFSFYNSILPDDSKDKLTDSKESYMDVQIHFILMAGISGHIDIFETFMNKNLIINKKLTGVIGLSKKHKNVFTSNVIGACAYYGKSQLLDFILKNYKDEIDINIVTTEKKSKNSKLGFSKEFTGCTPPLLAVVGPSSDKDTLQILKILKNYGAKFTAIDCNKNNILHLATKDNKIETAKYICDELGLKNLNNENNKDGYTPLSLAQHMNNEIFITYFCNINEDDEKKIEENWKELLEDSKKRDAKLNKKKKKKKGKNTDDDMPMLLNSTEYQETLKSEIKKEEPEKEEDIIIGLKIKKNKKNKKNKENDNSKQENQNNNTSNEKVKYFLMIPLAQDNFINTFNKLCQKLETEKPKNFNKNLFIKPQKLHITLVVLDINEDKEKTEKVITLINSLMSEIKNILSDELIFNFDKYDCFESIKKTRVIFAKMIEDENHYKLKLITNLIIKKLLEENILNKKDFKNLNISEEYSDGELIYTIKYHVTLLNLKYLNKALKEENKPLEKEFDSTDIFQCIKDIEFPDCKMDTINLCAMREDPNNEKYEVIHSFNIL